MNVSYSGPLQRSWARMQRILFRPFDLRTWLVLGFAAFLSEALVSGHGARYRMGPHGGGPLPHGLGGLLGGGVLAGLGMMAVAIAVVIGIVLLWVHTRGRFIFLDGVIREREAIVEPWHRYARLGNSLFRWAVVFILVCIAIVGLMTLPFIATIAALWSDGHFHWGMLGAVWALMAVLTPFGIVVGYTLLFLSDFVIPIMARHDVGVVEAWRRFLGLMRAHLGAFLLYGLVVLCLWIVVGMVVAVAGFSTCCVGFVLFGIPYVSSVVLLPVLVTFRSLGPEFLAQFGPEWSVFAIVEPPAPVATAPVPPPAPPPGAGS